MIDSFEEFFPRAAKCFFCFDKWPRRNCFQRIILSVKLPKPKRAYAAFIISTIQALFELNSDMRHGLETATWDSGNGDTENDTKTNWTCDSNKESANRVVKYRQRLFPQSAKCQVLKFKLETRTDPKGYFRNFWVGMFRWDTKPELVQLNFATLYKTKLPKFPIF